MNMKAKVIISTVMLMACCMANAQTKETAILFSGTEFDESYLLADNVSVVFDEDNKARICLDGADATEFVFDKDHPVTAEFKDAFKIKANQDPNNTSDYYSTFFTNKGAYKLPQDKSVTAYAGIVDGKCLKMTNIGDTIHMEEPVILKASQSDIILMPSCNKASKKDGNALLGTEEGITSAEDNVYALSYGESGVGFYQWKGKEIGANKAYLTLPSEAKALAFEFDDGTTTGIESLTPALSEGEGAIYNLNGIRVNNGYKGIVIKNGKKIYQR